MGERMHRSMLAKHTPQRPSPQGNGVVEVWLGVSLINYQ